MDISQKYYYYYNKQKKVVKQLKKKVKTLINLYRDFKKSAKLV